MQLEQKIEAILLFKNEPVTLSELSKILKVPKESVELAISNLQKEYESRGIVLVTNSEEVSLGTHPEAYSLIEEMQKEEFSRELGRAGLETLAIVLYKGPVSRREIDYIRGVNSTYTLRSLVVRGLVEKSDGSERGYSYKPTLKLLEHLGVTRREDLPEFETAYAKVEAFVNEVEQAEKENHE